MDARMRRCSTRQKKHVVKIVVLSLVSVHLLYHWTPACVDEQWDLVLKYLSEGTAKSTAAAELTE